MNRIQSAFDDIRADDALLEKTAAYLQSQRGKRSNVRRFPHTLRRMAAFAAMLVLVVGVFSYTMLFTAIAHVSIDVNPSVELTLNRMNRVIGTFAFNDDGERILGELNLNGKRYDEAVALLVSALDAQGYLSDDALVSATVQTANNDREQSLCDTLLQSLGAVPNTAEIEVFPVSSQVLEEAHGCHMTPAKYLAIQELLAVDDTATLEEYSDSNIRQIRQRTRACQEEHGGGNSNDGDSGGHGNGSGQGGNQGQGQGQSGGEGQHGQGQGGGHGHGYRGGQ